MLAKPKGLWIKWRNNTRFVKIAVARFSMPGHRSTNARRTISTPANFYRARCCTSGSSSARMWWWSRSPVPLMNGVRRWWMEGIRISNAIFDMPSVYRNFKPPFCISHCIRPHVEGQTHLMHASARLTHLRQSAQAQLSHDNALFYGVFFVHFERRPSALLGPVKTVRFPLISSRCLKQILLPHWRNRRRLG